MAIPKIYKHGIEIVKPWSTEMYDYNENVRDFMIKEIKSSINFLDDKETANKLACIMGPKYGEGFEIEEIKKSMLSDADDYENYWLAEVWDELIDAGFVKPNFGEGNEVYHIIGFESKEEIKELRIKFA